MRLRLAASAFLVASIVPFGALPRLPTATRNLRGVDVDHRCGPRYVLTGDGVEALPLEAPPVVTRGEIRRILRRAKATGRAGIAVGGGDNSR